MCELIMPLICTVPQHYCTYSTYSTLFVIRIRRYITVTLILYVDITARYDALRSISLNILVYVWHG